MAEAFREGVLLVLGQVLVRENEDVVLDHRVEDGVAHRIVERLRQIDAGDLRAHGRAERTQVKGRLLDTAPRRARFRHHRRSLFHPETLRDLSRDLSGRLYASRMRRANTGVALGEVRR